MSEKRQKMKNSEFFPAGQAHLTPVINEVCVPPYPSLINQVFTGRFRNSNCIRYAEARMTNCCLKIIKPG